MPQAAKGTQRLEMGWKEVSLKLWGLHIQGQFPVHCSELRSFHCTLLRYLGLCVVIEISL